jgi:O-antigen/teichoic acid export membrane protein
VNDTTRHSALLIGTFVTIAIMNYGFGVAMSWLFNPVQFGVLGVTQSLLLLAALVVGSGFAWTTAQDVAASGVTNQTRHRFRAAWIANVTLGLIVGGGLWVAYVFGWLPLGPAYRALVPLLGLTVVMLAARSVVNGAVRGQYRFGPLAVNQVGEVAIKAGTGLVLVAAGAGVAGVMVGFAVGTAAALAHSLWVTHSARLWRGRGWTDRQVIVITLPLFAGMLGTALIVNLDILGLKFLTPANAGDELAGLYQAAVILARTPVFVAQSLTLVLFSYVAGKSGGVRVGERGPAGYVQEAARAWFRLLLPAGLTLVLAPRAALSLFFPDQYQAAVPALRMAAAGGVLLALVTLLTAVFQAAGDRRRPALASMVAIVTQVVVLVWLVPRWGALGAATSLLAAGCVGLVGLLATLKPQSGSLLVKSRVGLGPGFLRAMLPLLALVIPLLLLPDGARGAALLKLGLAALSYLVTLMGIHSWSFDRAEPPVASLFGQLVHVLLGG